MEPISCNSNRSSHPIGTKTQLSEEYFGYFANRFSSPKPKSHMQAYSISRESSSANLSSTFSYDQADFLYFLYKASNEGG